MTVSGIKAIMMTAVWILGLSLQMAAAGRDFAPAAVKHISENTILSSARPGSNVFAQNDKSTSKRQENSTSGSKTAESTGGSKPSEDTETESSKEESKELKPFVPSEEIMNSCTAMRPPGFKAALAFLSMSMHSSSEKAWNIWLINTRS